MSECLEKDCSYQFDRNQISKIFYAFSVCPTYKNKDGETIRKPVFLNKIENILDD